MTIDVKPVTDDLWPDLESLFGPGGASNGCWCMYWILGAEYHKRPREKNKRALHSDVASSPPPGLLAFDERSTALGWCRLTPRSELPWLDQRKDLPRVDDLPVLSLPCFYVPNRHRGKGVMTALIDGAVKAATDAGTPAVEAYPVDTSVEGSTKNLFPGVLAAFERAGFVEVARETPTRPVVRFTVHD